MYRSDKYHNNMRTYAKIKYISYVSNKDNFGHSCGIVIKAQQSWAGQDPISPLYDGP